MNGGNQNLTALFCTEDPCEAMESYTYDLWGKGPPKGWHELPKRSPSYVYLIAAEGALEGENVPQVVKIGVTSGHPSARLATFQTGSPSVLELLACIEGDETLERALHAAFSDYRNHGEWFVLRGTVRAFVRHIDQILGWTPGNKVIHHFDFAEAIAEHVLKNIKGPESGIFWGGDLQPLMRWFKSIGLVRSE